MEITFEQFVRGLDAIKAHRALCKTVYDAFWAAGEDRVDGLGGSGLMSELTRQLEERCNDPSYEPKGGGSMISYMLYDLGGPVTEEDGTSRMVNTPELLWTYWQETASGPFSNSASLSRG